jgi:hypothetical protein
MQAVPVSVNKTKDTRPAAFKKRASSSGKKNKKTEVPAKFNRMTLKSSSCNNADSGGNVAASHESNVAI